MTATRATVDPASQGPGRVRQRVPPNLFVIPFGLAGLGGAWQGARRVLSLPAAIPDAIFILAAVVWLVLLVGYLRQGVRQILAHARDPVLSPFVATVVIPPMMLAGALATVAFTAGRVLVIVFLAMTIAVGGWLTANWISGGTEQARIHPGYFLPTVAGGLIGSSTAAGVHLHLVAEGCFGIGLISWLLLNSTVLSRLFLRPWLPPGLVPTMALESAPAALAGLAYFALTGGAVNIVSAAFAGYLVLMVVVQVGLLPRYLRLHFTPALWSFTFPYAAIASVALAWIRYTRPAGGTGYAIAVLVLITGFIAVIAAGTVLLALRGQFRPAAEAG
jgi:tellurite resistance protein